MGAPAAGCAAEIGVISGAKLLGLSHGQADIPPAGAQRRQWPLNRQLRFIKMHPGFGLRHPGSVMQVKQLAAGLQNLKAMGAALRNQQGVAPIRAEFHGVRAAP